MSESVVLGTAEDHAVLDEMAVAARAESAACARKLAAMAELYGRRHITIPDADGRERWWIDPWESVAIEIGAALSMTPAMASAQLRYALALNERLPKVAARFANGDITFRQAAMIVGRTELALDPEVMARIDDDIADSIGRWKAMSLDAATRAVDVVVIKHDREAIRRTKDVAKGRHVGVDKPNASGTADIWGTLLATDADVLDRRLTAMAGQPCDADPRTADQRRADALGALATGLSTLACACCHEDCPAETTGSSGAVVVHLIADREALEAADTAELHGEQPEPQIVNDLEDLAEAFAAAEVKDSPAECCSPKPAVMIGGGVVPASVVADLIARGAATVRPLVVPAATSAAEPRYRPSRALADFIRARDLTCRFPGCRRPADRCDIDHSVPYGDGGLTHPSNLKCLCRKHHLFKTFWFGWRDVQHPDGTVVWTGPDGKTYTTTPGSSLHFPALTEPTGALPVPLMESREGDRTLMMPRRNRTRADELKSRVTAERAKVLTFRDLEWVSQVRFSVTP